MQPFGIAISQRLASFLAAEVVHAPTLAAANARLQAVSGILSFFGEEADWLAFQSSTDSAMAAVDPAQRRAFGDFQTPLPLAATIVGQLQQAGCRPTVVIEPTCGQGSFVLAALTAFDCLEQLYAVEIFKPYLWEAKFAVLEYFLTTPRATIPRITFIHASVFDVDFEAIAARHRLDNVLIVGNPPWVTNAALSVLGSSNLPPKSNFRQHSGLAAITGKGNFDLGESVLRLLLHTFQEHTGHMAMLVKHAVVKNIVLDQRKQALTIGDFQQWSIDSMREFGATVEAALLLCTLGSPPALTCMAGDFYDRAAGIHQFGWVEGKSVADVELYAAASRLDGQCPFEWRSGVKHDCTKVMEFESVGTDRYQNREGAIFSLEPDLVHGLVKSADLQYFPIARHRKHTLITQHRPGASTDPIAQQYPATHAYLHQHAAAFAARKSSIYKGMPPFSIFGIGEYSFKPYKVAISALYKYCAFSLVLPIDGKPLMLDDTCNFIGFDRLEFAVYTLMLLNLPSVRQLLDAITFSDAKRPFTKEVLMRIDLAAVAQEIDLATLAATLQTLNPALPQAVDMRQWEAYLSLLMPQPTAPAPLPKRSPA